MIDLTKPQTLQDDETTMEVINELHEEAQQYENVAQTAPVPGTNDGGVYGKGQMVDEDSTASVADSIAGHGGVDGQAG